MISRQFVTAVRVHLPFCGCCLPFVGVQNDGCVCVVYRFFVCVVCGCGLWPTCVCPVCAKSIVWIGALTVREMCAVNCVRAPVDVLACVVRVICTFSADNTATHPPLFASSDPTECVKHCVGHVYVCVGRVFFCMLCGCVIDAMRDNAMFIFYKRLRYQFTRLLYALQLAVGPPPTTLH